MNKVRITLEIKINSTTYKDHKTQENNPMFPPSRITVLAGCRRTMTVNLNLNQFSRTNTTSPPTNANPPYQHHLKNSLKTPMAASLPVFTNGMSHV